MLIVAGFHVPVMGGMLVEPGGSAGAVLFMHSGPICANVGVICRSIVISIVVMPAHCPASGVNV